MESGQITVSPEGIDYTPSKPRCDQCKWWGVYPRHEPGYVGWRVCYSLSQPASETSLHASNALPNGNQVNIFTKPEFGCVHFEPIKDA